MALTLAGKICHATSLLTLILTVIAYFKCDIKGRYAAVTDSGAPAEVVHFQMATFILGTAWVLEFIQVLTSIAHGRGSSEDIDYTDVLPRSHLVRWSDSQLMLFVYSVLFGFYSIMSGGSFGLVHVDPFASNRPVYGLRYVEWSLAVPVLMILVGRSIPRSFNLPPADLLPAILLTVVYIYASWLALIIDDYTWRTVLIVISFVGYAFAAWDQYNWTLGFDRKAPSAHLSCGLLLFQVVLFAVYGVVYLVAAFNWASPVTEQALYTFGDATAKVGHSAVLLAMRQRDILAAVQAARRQAAVTAADLSRLVDAASAPILSIDLNGRVTTWNRMLAELTGRSAESMQGIRFLDVVSPSSRSEVAAAIESCTGENGDSSKNFQADLLALPRCDADNSDSGSDSDREPQIVCLIMNVTPQRDGARANTGFVCVGQDRTEVVHYKAVEERKNRFMATVSHELRSPLHGICGLASSLERGETDDTRKRQIAMVRSCATRLLDLVVNIMDLSAQRNKANKHLSKDPVHLAAIIEEVVALIVNATDKAMQPLLSESCKLTNKVEGQALPIVEGDSYKLTQVFFNLLTNACKFCRAGNIEVAAEVDHVAKRVRISVRDTGIGIAPEALKRIFEPFEQEDTSVGRRFEGIGIGLSVSDGVVRQHGGEINVTSVQGQGSVFTVNLPFVPDLPVSDTASTTPLQFCRPESRRQSKSPADRPSVVQLPAEDSARSSSKPVTSKAAKGARPIVLSVDDDMVNQEVIISALTEYEVHTAMDGPKALNYFAKNSRLPDVILLDVMMPGMSGFEVCIAIRQQLQLPPSTLPIIMLSAKEPVPGAIIESLGSGCNDYISKPFQEDVLQARVRTALQVKRLHEVELENAQHESLLHEIMPSHIVQRLLSGENCISESHQSVTILFSDIVGWTNIAESIPTSAVITLLNELFSAFDGLLSKFGVYKVETIGDAYMVAAGHDGTTDHAKRVVNMGLGMLEAVKSVRPPPNMRLQIRVGVHSGPAFTGVVGQKVPRFCFFGDTVNVSSRMESNGVPGCIHISQAARDCLGDDELTCASIVSRGVIDVKGKGHMETHFVVPTGVLLPSFEEEKKGDSSPTKKAGPESSGDAVKTLQAQLESSGDAVKTLQAQLAEANSTIAVLRSERDEQFKRAVESAAAVANMATSKPSVASLPSPSPADTSICGSLTSTASDANTTALRLELAVKKKALERTRRALLDKEDDLDALELVLKKKAMERNRRALLEKDDELDAKELELQHVLMALNDAGLAQVGTSRQLISRNPIMGNIATVDASSEDSHLRQRRANSLSGIIAND